MLNCYSDEDRCRGYLQELPHRPSRRRIPNPRLPPKVRAFRSFPKACVLIHLHSLAFSAEVAQNANEKLNRIIPMLKERTGPAIVYVTTQKQAEEIANNLMPHGLEPMVYHAGLPGDQREDVQQKFMNSDRGIVCATIAFGMGIDKGE